MSHAIVSSYDSDGQEIISMFWKKKMQCFCYFDFIFKSGICNKWAAINSLDWWDFSMVYIYKTVTPKQVYFSYPFPKTYLVLPILGLQTNRIMLFTILLYLVSFCSTWYFWDLATFFHVLVVHFYCELGFHCENTYLFISGKYLEVKLWAKR